MLCNVTLKLWFQCNLLHFDYKILTLPAVGDGHYIPLIPFTLKHLEFCKVVVTWVLNSASACHGVVHISGDSEEATCEKPEFSLVISS